MLRKADDRRFTERTQTSAIIKMKVGRLDKSTTRWTILHLMTTANGLLPCINPIATFNLRITNQAFHLPCLSFSDFHILQDQIIIIIRSNRYISKFFSLSIHICNSDICISHYTWRYWSITIMWHSRLVLKWDVAIRKLKIQYLIYFLLPWGRVLFSNNLRLATIGVKAYGGI